MGDLLDLPIAVDTAVPAASPSTCASRTVNGPGNEQFAGPVPCVAGFCVENAPATTWLWAVAGASRASVWAVGDGALLHHDGSRWDTACAPLDGWMLHAAHAASDSDVWIAGHGTIGHFDGRAWAATRADPGWAVFEIWGDAGEAFATYAGTPTSGILRWDGATWAPSYGGPFASDLSVWGNGAGQVWGVDGGNLIAWDGQQWTTPGRPFNLKDVWAPAGGEPWFSGFTFRDPEWWVHDAAASTLVGGSYARHALAGYWEARWVRGSAGDDVWIGATDSEHASGGSILRWDGASWAAIPSPGEMPWFAPLVLGRGDAWVVDNPFDPTLLRSVSRVMRFDGARWSESLVVDTPPVSAVVTTPGGVWAAADDGLWRFDGIRWVSVHGPLGHSVQLATDGERVWATGNDVGDGSATVAFWDGAQLLTYRFPGAPTALHASGGHAWVATQGSTSGGVNAAVHHWDGATWEELDTGAAMSVLDLWASAPDDVWVVGAIYPASWTSQTGVIAHWNGAAWVRRELTDYEFRSVWGSGANDVWLSGDTAFCQKCPPVEPAPLLLRWDGARLSRAATLALDEISGAGSNQVWGISSVRLPSALDRVAVLHRFDGTRWSSTARLEAPFRPYRLHVGADGTLWGVDGGRMLRRAPTP